MKRKLQILISVVALLCFTLGVNAQDFTSGEKYLFKNVESGKFLGAANDWGTQASLLNTSEYVILYENEDGTYYVESQVTNGDPSYYLGSNGYMDSQASPFAIIPSGNYYLITPDQVNYYGYNGTSVLALDLSADDKGALWQIISVDDMLASFANVTPDTPVDATFMILDPNFGRNNRNRSAWTVSASNIYLHGGAVTNQCTESYHSTFTLSQTLTNMPFGLYELSAQGFYRNDGEEEDVPYFFIGDQTRNFLEKTGTENSMNDASNSFSAGDYTIEPISFVGGGDITIGAKLEQNTNLWCIWDNFILTYYGPTEDDPDKVMLDAVLEKALETYPLEELDQLVANEDSKLDYRSAIESALAAEDSYDIHKQNVEFALSELSRSVKAYTQLLAKFDEWNRYVDAHSASDTDEWNAFRRFMTGEVEVVGYPTPLPSAIQEGDYSLSTTDINNYIADVTSLFIKAKLSEASENNPVDATDFIVNPAFDTQDISGWNNTFENGINATNVGYQYTAGTSYITIPGTNTRVLGYVNGEAWISGFIEAWTSSYYNTYFNGPAIGQGQLSQTIASMPAGKYKFTVNCISVNQQGYAPNGVEGVQLFATGGNVDIYKTISTGNGVPEHFEVVFVNDTEGAGITLGLRTTEACNANWIAADNFTLTYYGPTYEDPYKVVLDAAIAEALKQYPLEGLDTLPAYNVYKQEYKEVLEAAQAATENYAEYETAIEEAIDKLTQSIDSYQKLFAKIEEWKNNILENPTLASDQWTAFNEFVYGQKEIEGYPTPIPSAISAGNYALDINEIDGYIDQVEALYHSAYVSGISEGFDCTNMIVNANFADGFKGWTYRSGIVGNNNVECYEQVVDIYQIVEDVPDGIYSISVQAFERPASNGNFDGSEASKVFLYMNNFKTPVQNICKDLMPLKKAQPAAFDEDGEVIYGTGNCYLDPNGRAGGWPYDYQVDTLGYVPNSIDGARIAFDAGRYVQKCYGVVEDGVMKIGLTSNGVRAHWVLWANFKLTFEGKNAEALSSVLPTYLESLRTYTAEHQLTAPIKNEIQEFLVTAEQAIQSGDADTMWDALIYSNTLLEMARENVLKQEDYRKAVEYYETERSVLASYDETQSEDIWVDIEELDADIDDNAYLSLDNDALVDLIGRINDLTNNIYYKIDELKQIDGIYYNFDAETMTASVVKGNYLYSGDVVIPETVVKNGAIYTVSFIEDNAFSDCYDLYSVTIPRSVTWIGYYAFGWCYSLSNVYCLAEDLPEVSDNPFYASNAGNATLHVPAASIDAYRETWPWSNFYQITELEQQNILAISDVTAKVGSTVTVPVELVNGSDITGIEFDLLLPEGITLEDYEWAGRQGKKHSVNFAYKEETGTYKVLIFSSSSDPFNGNEGTLLNLVLNVDAAMEEGPYDYGMINIKLVTPDERTFRPADTYAAFVINNTLRGDANGDGIVDITDVVSVVNYILDRPSDRFNFAGADINNSGDINVVDVVGIVNIILQRDVAGAKSRDMEALSNALMMLNEKEGVDILVEGAAKFAAMQFDVVASDNANLLDAILNSNSDHQISFAKIDANRYRVIAFSMDNESFEPTEDALIHLVLNGIATIENATFVAADGRSMMMNITGDATDIAGISSKSQEGVIYNLAGQRMGTSTKSLPTGVYIRNGKRILVR